MTHRRTSPSVAGFTLLEAMLSVALTAAIVLSLATLTAQWLPNWRRGFVSLQRADLLSIGLERILADVASAEFVSPSNETTQPLFRGEALSLIFVRSALGPGAHPHLEVVRLAEAVDERGFAIVRTRAPFTPGTAASQYAFADPVVLVRAPFRVSFAFSGPDRVWVDSWGPNDLLPTAVRVTVRDAATGQVLAASTAALLKVTAKAVPASPPESGAPGAGQPAPANAEGQATPGSPGQMSAPQPTQ